MDGLCCFFALKEIMRIGQGNAKAIGERKVLSLNVGLKCAAGLVSPSSTPSHSWFYFAESSHCMAL